MKIVGLTRTFGQCSNAYICCFAFRRSLYKVTFIDRSTAGFTAGRGADFAARMPGCSIPNRSNGD